MEISRLWTETLKTIEQELSKPSFETWVKPTHPIGLLENTLVIGVPNEFARDWLETRYATLIRKAVRRIFQRPLDVEFMITTEENEPVSLPPKGEHSPRRRTPFPRESFAASVLNPKYTFDTFVVGNSNRFAHAASLAVAETPAKAYNPLFVYGGVGLGKTHLMHAIGHYVLTQHPHSLVVYVTSEKFTNQLINAIRDDTTADFRNQYRSIDVLLIDDIQFLAGKERTQEEFFHTFNSLHEASKQIIISSDRPPKEIPTLEERLRSRFEWGLITDIQPPDLETRVAILRKKARLDNLNITDDVLLYIATKIDTNIRELEGALIRVMAYSSLTNSAHISVDLASEALKDILPETKPKVITIRRIQEAVAEHFQLSLNDLIGKKRTRTVAYPRQIAMYLCREYTDASLPRIGEEFGGRDHTTVMHANEKIKEELASDSALQQNLETIKKKFL